MAVRDVVDSPQTHEFARVGGPLNSTQLAATLNSTIQVPIVLIVLFEFHISIIRCHTCLKEIKCICANKTTAL